MLFHLVPFAYLALGAVMLVAAIAAHHPRLLGTRWTVTASFAGMMAVMIIPQWILVGLGATVALWWAGAMTHPASVLGLAFNAVAWLILLDYLWQMTQVRPILDGEEVADDDHPFDADLDLEARAGLSPGRVSLMPSLLPITAAMRAGRVTRNIVFRTVGGVRLLMDVYHGVGDGPRPAVLYFHGGAWIIGSRRQSRFLMYELAAAGFTVFAASYRLAPRFQMPSAIEDCKAALVWVRQHGAEHDARPDHVTVMGGSAGGHLAALLALTPNLPRFQPGFEEVDTRVDGAVILYGVSDLCSLFGERPHPQLASILERLVIRARFCDEPERFRELSPSNYVGPKAPPILLVHGTSDHLVHWGESRAFADRLRCAGAPSVHLLEVPLGQHAFELLPSPLHQRSVRVIIRFLASVARNAPVTRDVA